MNQFRSSTVYTLALYYMLKTPLEETPFLLNFVNGDDAYRNARFKMIPYIAKVSNVESHFFFGIYQCSWCFCFIFSIECDVIFSGSMDCEAECS